MSGSILVRNRQRTRNVNAGYLKKILLSVAEQSLGRKSYELGVHLVSRRQITEINERYLQHRGPTDVITFDYSDPAQPHWLAGDIFICVAEAIDQSMSFRTTWQEELVRYLIHGLLHLCGYDDQALKTRQRMKRAEDRLVAKAAREFDFGKIG